MPNNVLSVIIERFLKNPNNTPTQGELRGLLHSRIPNLKPRTMRQGPMPTLPMHPAGVSFLPLMGRVGARAARAPSPAATIWAQNTATLLGRLDQGDQVHILNEYRNVRSMTTTSGNIARGLLYTYRYEAKTVPWWDRYPLILCLEKKPPYMLGLNFHYLPIGFRFALFEALMPLVAPIPVDQLSRIYIVYRRLAADARYRAFRPALKKYRLDRIRSSVVMISPIEWPVALAYPSQQWVNTTDQQVWTNSVQKINKRPQS